MAMPCDRKGNPSGKANHIHTYIHFIFSFQIKNYKLDMPVDSIRYSRRVMLTKTISKLVVIKDYESEFDAVTLIQIL